MAFLFRDEMKASLFQAVKDGDAERVKELLQCGDYINARDEYGWTPLHYAAEHGQLEVAKELLKHEADVKAKTWGGWTPLHVAARNGHLDVAKELLKHKAEVNAKDKYGWTPLHYAAEHGQLEVAKELLKHEADVKAKTWGGWTPLHVAARNGHLDVAKELLKHKAEVNAKDKDGETPLHKAALGGRLNVAEELLERGAEVNATNKDGATPLHLAAGNGHLNVAEELLKHEAEVNATNTDGITPLHMAARYGHLNVAEELLEHKAEVNATNKLGETPLHYAAEHGQLEVANELLKHEADVKAKTWGGWTPLHVAARNGHLDVAKELLKHKAEVNAKDKGGWTPLHVAARNGHLDVAKELLKHKAEVNAKDKDGKTPLHEAAFGGHLNVAEELLEHKAEVNATNKHGWTPLHVAAGNGHLEVAKELLEHNADVNATTTGGWTPLHLAAHEGHLDVANELLKHKADVNAKDKNGQTPLHFDRLRDSWQRVAKIAHYSADDLVQHTSELVKIIVDGAIGPPELDWAIVLLSRLEELVQACPTNPIETAEASQVANAKDEAERGRLMELTGKLLEVDMSSWPADRVRSLEGELPRPPREIGLEMLERLLGAKVARLGLHAKDQTEKLEDLGKPGVSRFIGQKKVLDSVKPLIKHRFDPVSAEGAPVCLLFNGPPGCGKTELAKKIAEAVFEEPIDELHRKRRFIKFDMGQFKAPVHANNFFGAPLGYAGGEGTLFKALSDCCALEQASKGTVGKGCPEAVVLLDELDKANVEIRSNALLAAVDTKGQVQSNQGGMALRTERVIFIFTSNVKASEDAMNEALMGVFGEPLLSRTKVMQFNSLAHDDLLVQLVENELLRCKKNFQQHAEFKVPLLWTEQVPHMLVQAIKQKAEQEHCQINTRQLCQFWLPEKLRDLLHDHKDYKTRVRDGQRPVTLFLKVRHKAGAEKAEQAAQKSLEKAQAAAERAREAHDKAMNVVIQEQKKLQSLQDEVVPAHIWRSAPSTDQQAPAASVGPSLSQGDEEKRVEQSRALAKTSRAAPPLAGSSAGPAPTAHSHARAPAVEPDKAKAQLAATEIAKLQAQLAAVDARAKAAEDKCVELQGELDGVRKRARRAKTVSWLVFSGSTAALVALLLYRYPWMVRFTMVLVALAAALAALVSLILLIPYLVALITKKQDAFCSWLEALKDRVAAGIKKCTRTAIERSIGACFKFFCCSCKGGALGFGTFTFCTISFFMAAWHAAIDTLFTLALLGTALAPVQIGIINWLVEDSEPAAAHPPGSISDGDYDYHPLSDGENV